MQHYAALGPCQVALAGQAPAGDHTRTGDHQQATDPSQECESVHSMVQACAGAGCHEQCEAAKLRQATISSITGATSLEGAAVERQVPERTALPGNPQARECAGAAAAGYSLAQDGAGDEISVPAGAILVQESGTADPESELVLEHTTSYGYPQVRECAEVWTIGRSQDDSRGEIAAAEFSVADECAWFASSHVDRVMVSVAKKETCFDE